MNFYSNITKIQQEVHTAKVFCGSVSYEQLISIVLATAEYPSVVC